MTEVHHFIFNELKVAIRHSVPIVPLLDDLIRYNIISTQERDAWKSHGKNGMRRLIAKLRGKDFDTFILFVKCILEAGRRDSSVQMTIVNSIRGAADVLMKYTKPISKTAFLKIFMMTLNYMIVMKRMTGIVDVHLMLHQHPL